MKPYVYVSTEKMKVSHGNLVEEDKEIMGLMNEGELVAYVQYHDDGDNELFIDFITVEAPYQKQGHSTALLNKLLDIHPDTVAFTGESTAQAVIYWEAKGAIFEPTTFAELKGKDTSDDLIDFEGCLFPFCLIVSNTTKSTYSPYWEAS